MNKHDMPRVSYKLSNKQAKKQMNEKCHCYLVLMMLTGTAEIWKCWFLRGEKSQSTLTKTSQSKDENHHQTQPSLDTESTNQSWGTLVVRECSHQWATACVYTRLSQMGLTFERVKIASHNHHSRAWAIWLSLYNLQAIHFLRKSYSDTNTNTFFEILVNRKLQLMP